MLTQHPGAVGMLTGSSILASVSLSGVPAWIAIISGGASIFGLAALRATAFTWRGERNAEKAKAERLTLELAASVVEHKKTLHLLEVSEKRPDITKLYDLMRAHDERMANHGIEMTRGLADATKVLAEVATSLQANTSALQLWATGQAQAGFDKK